MAIEVRRAQSNDAAAACTVLRRSIAELCQADYGNDRNFLDAWLENKTVENVAAWISNPDNLFYVAIENC